MASRRHEYPLVNSLTTTTTLLILLIIDGSSRAFSRPIIPEDELVLKKHEEWIALHGRVYKDAAEKEARYNIFKENIRLIDAFNNNHGNNSGFTLGVNKFADLTNKEFRETYTGYNRKAASIMPNSGTKAFRYWNFTAVPNSMDWRAKKAVTSVKDQGDCGKPSICFCFDDKYIAVVTSHLNLLACTNFN